jgi:simple sugar transport system ATP-binding protein
MFGDEARIHAEEELETASAAAERLGEVVLDVSGISVIGSDGRVRVDDVSFTVRAGQVLAVIGVEGNGQSYLMDSLAGLQPCTGAVTLNGKDIAQLGPRARYESGLRAVTEDRLKWDVFRSASVSENVLAHEYAGRGSLGYVNPRGKTVIELVKDILTKFDVRPVAPKMALSKLSGGNQQRAVVGRESTGPKSVLLLSHPTRGLDVMGSAIILQDVRSQQAQGTAVVWNTADLEEAFVVGDVLLVMFQGRAALLVDRRSTSHEVVAAAMSGAN